MIQANGVITEVEAAWHPTGENTRQLRFFELDADTRTLRTDVQDHRSYPGWCLRDGIDWVRDP